MSAIAGIYYRDGRPVDRADLDRMVEALAHRGPDGSGVWHRGPVGLAHRMLWTTPESLHERLPLACEPAHLILTADARLDNRDDLISALGLGGRPREEIADGELILRAYERWGEECPAQLLGDFAFAIWDARRQKLICARDPIGVKCLYYYSTERIFAFATEIKALLCLPEVPRRLNEARVADFLVPTFDDRAITFYRDIFRLPAAHIMVVGQATTRSKRYWALDPSRRIRLGSDEEYAEGFREIFREAVRCRLRSAYPVASTLSGGLDSSSIACMASRILNEQGRQPLYTLSAIFPTLPGPDLEIIDERRYVEAVLALGGFEAQYVRADCLHPLIDVATILWHTDEAVVAPNLYIHRALYGAAQEQEARVFLDGIDGDTTVSHGLDVFAELVVSGRWRRLAREAAALAATANASYGARRLIWEYGVRPLIPEDAVDVWRAARRQSRLSWDADALINPDFARQIGLAHRVARLSKSERVPALTEREAHRRSLMSSLIPYSLELSDKAAAPFGLETRYPFFDRRLMEFCLALPPEQKLHHGWTRLVMRRAMSGILPSAVQWRKDKANLSPNFTRRLLDCGRETLERVILGGTRIIEEYVDMPSLHATYRRYASAPSPGDALTVFRAVMLALWLEQSRANP